jgi:GH25 family lysozyme M1 (1,4-beta-N-acetylmuramidase)
MKAHGVDLSHWDVSFDPEKATGLIDFAIQKASEGTFCDSKFVEIWTGVQKVPIRGAYHYLRSGINWQAQADFFISVVKENDFHFYALDFEGTGNTMGLSFANMAHMWIDYTIAKTGKPVLLYTNPTHYDADLFPYGDWMKDFPLWIAQYWPNPKPDMNPGMPKKRKAGDWTIYQYASETNYTGHAKEYGTPVNSIDLNVFNGTVAVMRSWLKLGEAPAEPTTISTTPAQPATTPTTASTTSIPTSTDINSPQIEMIDWMIEQLKAKKNEISGSASDAAGD